MKHPLPLLARYRSAYAFPTYAVLRSNPTGRADWLVVGPGLNWFGEDFRTYEEAHSFVQKKIKERTNR